MDDTCFTATGAGGVVGRYLTGIEITAIHNNELVNDSGLSATGAGGGDIFMGMVTLADGKTADVTRIVVATVTAITAASRTFKMVSVSSFTDIVAAGKCFVGGTDCAAGGTSVFPTFVMASLAEQIAAMVAGHVFFFTCVTNEVHATRALMVVTYLTGVVVTFQQIVVAFEEVTAAIGAFLCYRGVGVVVAVAIETVTYEALTVRAAFRHVIVTDGANLFFGDMVMVVAVAEIAVAIGAFSVITHRGITAADETLGGFDDGRTDMGGKDGDIFGVATADVDQVACDFVHLAVFKGVTVGHKRHHSTVQSFNGNVQIVAADGDGGGEGNVGTLGEVLELCHKKVFICLCTVDRLIQLVVLA